MADQRRRLILFARFPVAGKVKTRLIPALGAEGAAALHRRLVLRTLRTAHALCQSQDVELEIRCAGDDANAMQHWLGDGWLCRPQCEGDLGQRMAGAFADSFREGSPATVIIGSDCPALTPEVLTAAFESLKTNRVVFGPATDGGYYLVGSTRPVPELFQGIAWGTETVLAQSLETLTRLGSRPALLQPLDDLDRPEDVAAWKRLIESEENDLNRISVIIPALNEAEHIAATLESVRKGSPHEIIVVDGGSADETRAVAQKNGATVIRSKPGRARQMNAGAARVTGYTLLFLHADTLMPKHWPDAVHATMEHSVVVAGAFAFQIAGKFPGSRWVEWTTSFRSKYFQSPYGDQGLFMRRSLFESMGGFAALPILEDYEMVRRLRKLGKLVTAGVPATTSGRRWRQLGVIRTTLVNKLMIAGFHLGVQPERLAKLYRQQVNRHCDHGAAPTLRTGVAGPAA